MSMLRLVSIPAIVLFTATAALRTSANGPFALANNDTLLVAFDGEPRTFDLDDVD
mgnify:CR=1 FL=1